jgi:squalene-associated FAD-dependent desaturase
VAVVGGGFAGLAAAIALQERRHEVILLERRGVLGGRATSFPDAVTGEDVDNGTHLMIAGYSETLDLLRRAGAADLLIVQDALRIDWRDDRGWTSLACPPLPAPFHLLAGLLPLRMPWRSRLEVVRFGLAARAGRVPRGLTLSEWFRRTGQSETTRRLLWDPLATAILNETPERAAAVLFREVFREAFLRRADAARLVFLRAGYGRLHDKLARYLESRGGLVHRRALVDAVEIESGRSRAVRYIQRAETKADMRRGARAVPQRLEVDAVVVAVPWSALPALLPEELRQTPPFANAGLLRGSPIVSIELWLDRVVLDRAMAGLRDTEVEWVFDKGRLYGREGVPQHLAFIVSAAVRAAPRPNAELAAVAEEALRRYFPLEMASARVVRSLVLREPEATFVCGPEAEELRPGPDTPVAGLFLAGDWTNTGLPATIEGAVRSGRAAARRVEQACAAPAEASRPDRPDSSRTGRGA